jgi:hypothetical protein
MNGSAAEEKRVQSRLHLQIRLRGGDGPGPAILKYAPSALAVTDPSFHSGSPPIRTENPTNIPPRPIVEICC